MSKTFQMGRIAIGLQGEGPVFKAIDAELSENLEPSSDAAAINFRIIAELPDRAFRRNGSILISDEHLRVDMLGMRYEFTSLSDPNCIDVAFDPRRSRIARQLPRLSRFRNWNYLYRHEEIAKNFMYDLFDWATQLTQLKHGQSYIHASSIQRGDRGLAILGWGGVGKTTTLLNLVLEHEWKFLSDDLGIVDKDGNLYRAPKRLQIYGYNCDKQPRITERLMANRSIADRVNWSSRLALYGGKAVRRRVGAAALFGTDALCDTAPLSDIIYLEKSSDANYATREITSQEIASRMSAIVMAEIEPYPSLLREAEAAGFPKVPQVADVQKNTRDVLEKAFEGKRCVLVQTNEAPEPDRLVACINEITT